MIVAIAVGISIIALGALAFFVFRRRSLSRARAPGVTVRAVPAARPEGLGARVRSIFGTAAPTKDEWARLEDLLLRADVGPGAATRLVSRVRERYEIGSDPALLVAQEVEALLGPRAPLGLREEGLSVVMVVGVNGAGKTTTIGKLANRLAREGRKVSLANSDTFRAAAGEQLGVWAERAGASLVMQARGADPGAVAFDAVKAAEARGSDVLLVDTAGRLHTRRPLMDELAKVKRVLEKAAGDVEEVLLVLDATTGQNGIAQARVFTEAVEVTAVALAKLDGTAKGGIVLALREELGVPVKLAGTGEGIEDIEVFDPRTFAESLLGG